MTEVQIFSLKTRKGQVLMSKTNCISIFFSDKSALSKFCVYQDQRACAIHCEHFLRRATTYAKCIHNLVETNADNNRQVLRRQITIVSINVLLESSSNGVTENVVLTLNALFWHKLWESPTSLIHCAHNRRVTWELIADTADFPVKPNTNLL